MTNTRSITFPEEPEGKRYEHVCGAILASLGFFVEKNIKERIAHQPVLELDLFASKWENEHSEQILGESKSGSCGTKDLFKLLGQGLYLEADSTIFFHAQELEDCVAGMADHFEDYDLRHLQLNSTDVQNGNFIQKLSAILDVEKRPLKDQLCRNHYFDVWLYFFWLQQILIKKLVDDVKSLHDKTEVLFQAREILREIDRRFFIPYPQGQSCALYSCYKRYSNLAKRAIEERRKKYPGNDLKKLSEDQAFQKCVYRGAVPSIQGCMYIEHWSRCLILKAAVDIIMTKRNGTFEDEKIFGVSTEEMLPEKFQFFLETHRETEWINKLPQLWQSFLFCWGGFLLQNREEEEIEKIGQDIEMDAEAVKQGLVAFDELFPIDGSGWWYDQPETDYKLVKLVPCAIRGLGVQRRRWIYGEEYIEEFNEYTQKDLNVWSHCAFLFLKEDLSSD